MIDIKLTQVINMSNLSNQWLTFYNNIKDTSWPDVKTQDDVLLLPSDILKEIMFQHKYQSSINRLTEFNSQPLVENSTFFNNNDELTIDKKFLVNDIIVYYHQSLDGGGSGFGLRYKDVIKEIYKNKVFKNCFEWCSGPGFIGFDLLSHDICENLFLGEIYPPAIKSIEKTITHLDSKYQGQVSCAHIKAISDLPKEWKFDLVVSNPPHWNPDLNQMSTIISFRDRICADVGWKLHNEFFKNIKEHLSPDGIILLQEQSNASGPEMFRSMIEHNGLRINDCYWEHDVKNFYYLEVKHA
jgi:16S rRNA G966 N2-methylase RsmD